MAGEIVLAGAVRTPVGTFGGAFSDTSAAKLGAIVVAEALRRAGAQPAQVDELLFGSVIQGGQGIAMILENLK